jgi:hypothetical protein
LGGRGASRTEKATLYFIGHWLSLGISLLAMANRFLFRYQNTVYQRCQRNQRRFLIEGLKTFQSLLVNISGISGISGVEIMKTTTK